MKKLKATQWIAILLTVVVLFKIGEWANKKYQRYKMYRFVTDGLDSIQNGFNNIEERNKAEREAGHPLPADWKPNSKGTKKK